MHLLWHEQKRKWMFDSYTIKNLVLLSFDKNQVQENEVLQISEIKVNNDLKLNLTTQIKNNYCNCCGIAVLLFGTGMTFINSSINCKIAILDNLKHKHCIIYNKIIKT